MTHYSTDTLTELDLPGTRNSQLPTLYVAENHPQHPASNPGQTYVVMIRPTVAAMEADEQFEKELEVPAGQKGDLDAQGLLELLPGDYLFGRNELGSGRTEDDVVLAWCVGGDLQDDEDKERLDEATQRALGPEETRTRGAVHLERYFDPVKDNTRCYNVASSLERQPTIVAPNAQLKEGRNEEEVETLSRDLTSAVAPMAMKNMQQAPSSVQEAIRSRAEMLSLPRVGGEGNWAYQALQCNIASVPEDSTGDLSAQMGFFGAAHFDEGDSAGHYTNMITNSQLPDTYDPGYFHLLAFGVYVRLSNHGGFNFQGNRRHGGTGPFPPPGERPPADAYRFNLVSYPPGNMMNPRTTRWRIALGSGGESVFLTPEMRAAEYKAPKSSTGNESATFFKYGNTYMDRKSQAEFYSRSLYDMCRYFVNQIPSEVGFTIEPDDFIGSFSYLDKDEQVISAPRWNDALPTEVDNSQRGVNAREKRAASERVWEEHYTRTAGLIPSRFMRNPELREVVNPSDGASPPADEDLSTSTTSCDNMEVDESRDEGDLGGVKGAPATVQKGKKRKRDEDDKDEDVNEADAGKAGKKPKNDVTPRVVSPAGKKDPQKVTGGKSGKRSAGKTAGGVQGKSSRKAGGGSKGKSRSGGQTADAPESKFTFLFNKQTTRALLEQEVEQLMGEIKSVSSLPPADFNSLMGEVVAADQHISDTPGDISTPESLCILLDHVNSIQTTLQQHSFVTRKARATVVDARVTVRRWLDDDLPGLVNEEIRRGGRGGRRDTGAGWLSLLVRKLREIFSLQTPSFSFHSSHFMFHSEERNVTIDFYNKKWRMRLVGEQLEECIHRGVVEVVCGWIHYTQDQDRKLWWFVSALEKELGSEILTMDHTWKMVTNFKSTFVVSGSHPERPMDDSAAAAFRAELSEHPISMECTREHALYEEYRDLLQGAIGVESVSLAGKGGTGWAKYMKMWRAALAYIAAPSSPPNGDRYRKALREDPDAYLPIREKAPARQRVTGQSGPYAPATITTLPGIFSALIFRAITYRSPFCYDQQMVFDSWRTFTAYVDELCAQPGWAGVIARKDQYFCLDAPYGGAPNPTRNIELAKTYWESLSDRRWPEFSTATPKPSFSKMVQYFDPPRKKDATNLFPQLGNLSCMSLVCDLAYASICENPTIDEMAECITSWKSGSLKGLQVLGLLDAFPKGTKKPERVRAAASALQEVWDFLCSNFNDREREKMGLDIMVVEHSLWGVGRDRKFKFDLAQGPSQADAPSEVTTDDENYSISDSSAPPDLIIFSHSFVRTRQLEVVAPYLYL